MIKVDNSNDNLVEKYNDIKKYIQLRIKRDGLAVTAEKYKKIFKQKLDGIILEYESLSKNSYQNRIPYQKYILLMNSRLSNIGPIYELVPEYNQEWLIEMMCDCHFIYLCYRMEIDSLIIENYSSNYDDCMQILSR